MNSQGPLSGQRLGNKYLLGDLLGRGGFGAVYKAQNLYLNRPQAIKVLLEEHFNDPSFRERFIREAQTLAGLNHPNILPVYDFELEGNRAYLVMPFISGGTLHSILKQRGPLSLNDTESYLRQICATLDYAHARNVVHLDLKPLNLLHQEPGWYPPALRFWIGAFDEGRRGGGRFKPAIRFSSLYGTGASSGSTPATQ